MDTTAITTFISTVGFPIACCAAMFWQMNKQQQNTKEQMDKMTEAIANNTLAIQKLTDKLGGSSNGRD